MSSTETVVLVVLWFLGRLGSIAMGDLVHVLLVSAIIFFGFRPVRERRPTTP